MIEILPSVTPFLCLDDDVINEWYSIYNEVIRAHTDGLREATQQERRTALIEANERIEEIYGNKRQQRGGRWFS